MLWKLLLVCYRFCLGFGVAVGLVVAIVCFLLVLLKHPPIGFVIKIAIDLLWNLFRIWHLSLLSCCYSVIPVGVAFTSPIGFAIEFGIDLLWVLLRIWHWGLLSCCYSVLPLGAALASPVICAMEIAFGLL